MPDDVPLYLGLISGTSADGIDAALVRFEPDCRLVFGRTYPWDETLRARLIALGQGGAATSLDELGALDTTLARAFADAALQAVADAGLQPRQVQAIGSHGQTVRHRPEPAAAFTWQMGDGNVIAERSGITTVADFRRRDVAAGGHGAPLVPAFHAALLHSADEDRAVLNLGGIGNYTLLPKKGDVRGFDTGPANALLDAWCLRHTGQPFDADGAFAASGQVDGGLLERLLDEAWFALPPPKSTGREQFHLDWLQARQQVRIEAAAGGDGAVGVIGVAGMTQAPGVQQRVGRAGVEAAHVALHRQQRQVGDAAEVEHRTVFILR